MVCCKTEPTFDHWLTILLGLIIFLIVRQKTIIVLGVLANVGVNKARPCHPEDVIEGAWNSFAFLYCLDNVFSMLLSTVNKMSARYFICKKDVFGTKKILQASACHHGKLHASVWRQKRRKFFLAGQKNLRGRAVITTALCYNHRVLPVGFLKPT